MVKAIAYAKVKTDKVDARILADLLRTDMIPECYIPDEKIRNLRDLRRRHYFVNTRSMFKNKVHVELSKRWIDLVCSIIILDTSDSGNATQQIMA